MRHSIDEKEMDKIPKAYPRVGLVCILSLGFTFFFVRLVPSPTGTATIKSAGKTLALEQSFGFFDDITDEQWRQMQDITSRTFPNHWNNGSLAANSNLIEDGLYGRSTSGAKNWYGSNFQEEFHCAFAERVPSTSQDDGPKWVCDPVRIRKQKRCLVYSVGSDGKTEFEQGVKDQISEHCEIHTFDVVTSNGIHTSYSSRVQPFGTFHHWGIGTQEQADKYRQTKTGPPMKTLEETMKELGHENRTIDIFKIDCELCEWHTYKQWLKQDLRQILVETHRAPMPNAKDFFYDLHDAGYVIFSKEANYMDGAGCVEFGFLKLSTDFFINGTLYKNRPPVNTELPQSAHRMRMRARQFDAQASQLRQEMLRKRVEDRKKLMQKETELDHAEQVEAAKKMLKATAAQRRSEVQNGS